MGDNSETVKEKKNNTLLLLSGSFLQFDHFQVLNFKKVHQNTDLSFS